jgi:hypothetical protein
MVFIHDGVELKKLIFFFILINMKYIVDLTGFLFHLLYCGAVVVVIVW